MTEDLSYLGEGLKAPALVDLMDNTHPVTHDFVGKVVYLNYEGTGSGSGDTLVTAAHFVDSQNMEWWVESVSRKHIRKAKYVIFEITKDIYFVTWVDATASDEIAPLDESNIYEDNYLVAFVLDMNKMVVTDAYMGPNKDGLMQFHLAQASAVVKNAAP